MKRRRALCIMAVKKLDDVGFKEKEVREVLRVSKFTFMSLKVNL
jgi:hypothetical protein